MKSLSIPEQIALLIERDGAACHYCKRRLNPWEMTRDHKIPRTQLSRWRRNHVKFPEGWNKMRNLVIACAPCNVSKGDMSYEDFLALSPITRRIMREKNVRALERKKNNAQISS